MSVVAVLAAVVSLAAGSSAAIGAQVTSPVWGWFASPAGARTDSAPQSGDGMGVSSAGANDPSMSLGALLAMVGSVLVDAMSKPTAQ